MATQSQQQQRVLASHSYCSMEPLAHPKMEIRVQKAYCDPRLGNIDIPCPLAVSVSSCHPQPHYVPLSLLAGLASFVLSSIEIRFLLCFLHCHLQREHQHIRLLQILFGIHTVSTGKKMW